MTKLQTPKAGDRLYFYGYCATYRRGPVPHTGCRGFFRCFRHPRTQQERRLNVPCGDEEAALLTPHQAAAIQKSRPLPSSWDDVPRSSLSRSWKRHRYNQYRRVAAFFP